MIDVRSLTHTYPGRRGQGPTLEDITFTAHQGRVTFVLGPNGSGKSTLFKLLLKLLPLQSGAVQIGGRDLTRISLADLAQVVAYIPQDQHVTFNFTVLDTVLMGRTAHMGTWSNRLSPADHALAEEALDSLGISHLASRGLRELSGGERQLVFTARALCQGGRVLLLDEPTSNLDFGNQETVLTRVRGLAERGYLVLITSHNPMHALHYADSLLLLKAGRLLGHLPPEQVTAGELSDLYSSPIRIVTSPQAPELRICLPDPNTKENHGLATLR